MSLCRGWENVECVKAVLLRDLILGERDIVLAGNALRAMFDARDKAKAAGVLERLGALGVSFATLGGEEPYEMCRIVFGFRPPSPPPRYNPDA